MAFFPEGVVPLCEDPAVEIIIGSLPVTDARGLAQMPPPPPPSGGGGPGQALGGGVYTGASGSAPEPNRGGIKCSRAPSPILVEYSSSGASSATASPPAGGLPSAPKQPTLFSSTWRLVRPAGARYSPVSRFPCFILL